MQEIIEEKQQLRKRFKQKMQRILPEEKVYCDTRLMENVLGLGIFKLTQTVFLFASTANEPNTHVLIQHCFINGKHVALPRCSPNSNEMDFYYIHSFADLSPGRFGILEPLPGCQKASPGQKGIMLVPGVAFDKTGMRLGQGKGFYDRYLQGYKGISVGVCFESCLVERLPRNVFDRPVHMLVTERAVYDFRPKNK